MNMIKNYLTCKYGLSNYQIAQLAFIVKSTSSELSKILLMGVLFYKHLKLYVFLLLLMCCIRTFSGGFHFYTYWGCLIASTIYIGSIITVLSRLTPPLYARLFLLAICIIVCYAIGPVLSIYRTNFPEKQLYICRNITCFIIFIYAITMYIIPENPYFSAGFWMIILHSLQLFVAKIRQKGELTK